MNLDPVRLLHDAVAIPSISGEETEVASFLADRCRALADRSLVDPGGNVVVEVGDGPLVVMVLGHIDTVPGEVPVRIEDGRLYGRGSVDAKGPLCCALTAALGVSAAARRAATFTVIGAVEEEAPSSRGARFVLDTMSCPDLLVIAEPSGWDALTLGYKGRLLLTVEATKANGHSAGEVPTAAADIVEAWTRISAWADEVDSDGAGIFDRIQVSLASITSSNDGLVQRAKAQIGFRLPLRSGPERVEAELGALPLPASTTLTFSGHEIAYRGERDSRLTRAFRSAIRSAGGRPVTKLKTGTSDMNVVAPHWPVPMLAYGPGDARFDHAPDEHLDIAEYERAIAVAAAAFETIATGATGPTVRSSSG